MQLPPPALQGRSYISAAHKASLAHAEIAIDGNGEADFRHKALRPAV